MYELAFKFGAIVGFVVWGLLLGSFLWTFISHWMNDWEGEKKGGLLKRYTNWCMAFPGDSGFPLFLGVILAPISLPILSVILMFFLINFVIPVTLGVLILLALLGRMVKRAKKLFTRHVDDKSVHLGGKDAGV